MTALTLSEAEDAYRAKMCETPGLWNASNTDVVLLGSLGIKVAILARTIASTAPLIEGVSKRPNAEHLTRLMVEAIDDQFEAEAWRVIHAAALEYIATDLTF